ncbi:flagellar FliJ family protein [Puerhibacterium puerhi]|uniref:flagellar FliJ family protein n=1 Tax=Puerhibacterium puerhi TaxID=2692623 RepID=UPI00135CBCA6|nr:flagellar FliJ family protein [Puerhibacterium puerhi]
MNRTFPLAGLLRVREVEEDRAAGELARAQRDRAAADERVEAVRAELQGQDPRPANDAAWQAMVAGRAALSALLSESIAARQAAEQQVRGREQDWTAARTRTRAVARLAERHAERVTAAERKAEQAGLDEIAARAAQEEER